MKRLENMEQLSSIQQVKNSIYLINKNRTETFRNCFEGLGIRKILDSHCGRCHKD